MKTLIGIDKTLQENNYQMLVANANQTTETEIQAIENFIKQKVAGIILLTKTLTNEHQKLWLIQTSLFYSSGKNIKINIASFTMIMMQLMS